MSSKKEISSPEDIKLLVDSFYAKVLIDPDISYIFTHVAKISMESHMPIMYSFWETILLGATSYKGNPMTTHIKLNRVEKLKSEHFQRWKDLFFETLDELFIGERVNEAKQRVNNMAALMQFKLAESDKKGFIQ